MIDGDSLLYGKLILWFFVYIGIAETYDVSSS